MTELTTFLASVYDSFSEAEMQVLRHGRTRLAELVESDSMPEDVTVPVYHASDVEVTLDVGLVAEETEEGTKVFVTETDSGDVSELAFTVDLFELFDEGDLTEREYDTSMRGHGSGSLTDETPNGESRNGEGRRGEGDERDEVNVSPPVGVVGGIDPQYRELLRAAGIIHLTDLVEHSPEDIAETFTNEDIEVSPEQAAGWLDEARGLAALLSEHETDLPVELVDGIGPSFGSRLREEGVADLSALVERSPEEVAQLATTGDTTVSSKRAGRWLEQAETTLRTIEERETQNGNGNENGPANSTDEADATGTPTTTQEDTTNDKK